MKSVTYVLLVFSSLVWAGILVSCFPGLWPRRVHEWIDGHRQVEPEQLERMDVVRVNEAPLPVRGPLCETLLAHYNAAHFLKLVDVPEPTGPSLRLLCRHAVEIVVVPAASEDDVYIIRRAHGRRRTYWAREPDLFRYLAHQQWRTAGGLKRVERRGRRVGARSHLRVVR